MDTTPESDLYDPARWSVGGGVPTPLTPKRRRRPIGRFLKGPVPMEWLQAAGRLPGKALAVGVELWHLSGLIGKRTVTFCLTRAAEVGIPTTTARRAVRALEAAGLISAVRLPGKGIEVTLVDIPDT